MYVWLNQDTWRFSNFCSLAFDECNLISAPALRIHTKPYLSGWIVLLVCLFICLFICLFVFQWVQLRKGEGKLRGKADRNSCSREGFVVCKPLNFYVPWLWLPRTTKSSNLISRKGYYRREKNPSGKCMCVWLSMLPIRGQSSALFASANPSPRASGVLWTIHVRWLFQELLKFVCKFHVLSPSDEHVFIQVALNYFPLIQIFHTQDLSYSG